MQDERLWQAVLGEIELSVSRGNYITWFKSTKLLKNKNGVVVIGVANVFLKQQMEIKYTDLIKDTLARNNVFPERIEFKIHSSASIKTDEEEPLNLNVVDQPKVQKSGSTNISNKSNSLSHPYRLGLNEKYTFETFIVGSGNELAYAACQAVAATPGSKYNPLFFVWRSWYRQNSSHTSSW